MLCRREKVHTCVDQIVSGKDLVHANHRVGEIRVRFDSIGGPNVQFVAKWSTYVWTILSVEQIWSTLINYVYWNKTFS